jgi:hypothetical protein
MAAPNTPTPKPIRILRQKLFFLVALEISEKLSSSPFYDRG